MRLVMSGRLGGRSYHSPGPTCYPVGCRDEPLAPARSRSRRRRPQASRPRLGRRRPDTAPAPARLHGTGDSDPADVYNAVAAFDDIAGVVGQLGLSSFVLIGLSMGGRNGMYFASRRPDLVQKLVVVDIGPEIGKRAMAPPSGPA